MQRVDNRAEERRVKKRRREKRRNNAEHRGRGKSKALESLWHDDDDGRVIVTTMLISDVALTSLISYTVVTDETHRHTDTKTE